MKLFELIDILNYKSRILIVDSKGKELFWDRVRCYGCNQEDEKFDHLEIHHIQHLAYGIKIEVEE